MKFYGYTEEGLEEDEPKALHLSEITVVANALELRKLASFFAEQAAAISKDIDGYEHEHLADNYPSFRDDPQLIIYNKSAL